MKGDKPIHTNIIVPARLLKKIDELARRERRSRTAQIRVLLEAEIMKYGDRRQGERQ